MFEMFMMILWFMEIIYNAFFLITAASAFGGVTNTAAPSAQSSHRFMFTAPSLDKNCIVIGGGPVGLIAALTLARPPHSYNVTLLESSEGMSSVSNYDPSRSYLYNINTRGLQWFWDKDMAPASALEKLQRLGYAPSSGNSFGQICVVPADPDARIPSPKSISTAMGAPQQNRSSSYWIPRHQMIELLYECCQEHNLEKNASYGSIHIFSGKHVETLYPLLENQDLISVQCHDGTVYTGSLVVAADGISSTVRSCLARAKNSKNASWLQSNAASFRARRYKSPATGLKLKALQFSPTQFVISNGTTNVDDNILPLPQFFRPQSTDFVSIRGINTGFRNRLSLGLLPIKDPNMIRPANAITPHDHEIWSLRNGTEAKAWFTRNFPRIDWDMVLVQNETEWERFVKARGTTYPYCQYAPGSAVSSPNGLSGVVMVGDSCHAFPPDIGQGINAGMQDVVALDRALRCVDIVRGDAGRTQPPTKLGPSLLSYQRNRRPEHAALIRLARFGSPYQYRQPWLRHRIGAFLWTSNVLFRLLLNKFSMGLIPPAAIMIMASNPSLTFRQVMRRADATAFSLQFLSLSWIVRTILRRWKFEFWPKLGISYTVGSTALCLSLTLLLKFIFVMRPHQMEPMDPQSKLIS